MSGPFATIPSQLAGALGISTDNAALLLSCFIIVSVALAIGLLGGRRLHPIIVIAPMIAVIAFLVAIAWMPIWILMVIAIIVAFMFATPLRSVLTGG
jgi:hypothetical protein